MRWRRPMVTFTLGLAGGARVVAAERGFGACWDWPRGGECAGGRSLRLALAGLKTFWTRRARDTTRQEGARPTPAGSRGKQAGYYGGHFDPWLLRDARP